MFGHRWMNQVICSRAPTLSITMAWLISTLISNLSTFSSNLITWSCVWSTLSFKMLILSSMQSILTLTEFSKISTRLSIFISNALKSSSTNLNLESNWSVTVDLKSVNSTLKWTNFLSMSAWNLFNSVVILSVSCNWLATVLPLISQISYQLFLQIYWIPFAFSQILVNPFCQKLLCQSFQ